MNEEKTLCLLLSVIDHFVVIAVEREGIRFKFSFLDDEFKFKFKT